ncbi:hypothetical protein [Psychroflexus torquis]|uniref:hypothetical protein n=1 Tax=Psychroflexus torquis TaxID=57029 RepID=UPI0000D54759|nr:hypothetical protein [Psychroflexus torquis]
MKILIFTSVILISNLFSINTYSQDIDLDCDCDYVIDSSDEKWSNGTLNSYDGATTNLIGSNTNFDSGLINVSIGSVHSELYFL